MRIAGLDPSVSSFGVALPGRVFTIRPKGIGPGRLATLRRELNRELQAADVDLAIVESYGFSHYAIAAQRAAEIGGVTRLLLYDLGIAYVEVPPTSLKLFATGHGNATKTAMLSAARAAFPLETFDDDNQADARWLREVGLVIVGKVQAAEHQRRALAGVVVPNGLRRLVGAR